MKRLLSANKTKSLTSQLERLGALGPEELNERWRELFASERPPRICGELLLKALAYRLQEKTLGGLKPATRRLLKGLGCKNTEQSLSAPPVRAPLKAGTVLVREWHGMTRRVTVIDDGYRFDGKRYRSLSEVARTITGSRWSGPRFFGLKSTAGEQLRGGE
jgi:DUF2924 family protein